jgi:hypothetical protein
MKTIGVEKKIACGGVHLIPVLKTEYLAFFTLSLLGERVGVRGKGRHLRTVSSYAPCDVVVRFEIAKPGHFPQSRPDV